MLLSTPQPAGRASAMPAIKCSNCGVDVPLDELGDHKCDAPAPQTKLSIPRTQPNNIPRPAYSPGGAASLLPKHLQGRVPGATRGLPLPQSVPQTTSSRPSNNSTSRSERPTVNTSQSSYSRGPPARGSDAGSLRSNSRDPYASGGESPIQNRPPVAPFARSRSGSDASSLRSPVNARAPPYNRDRDPPRVEERNANTQTGGDAGMAGVGRRGFAAAARAAVFTAPSPSRASPPRNIDTGAASKSSTTPPLSTSTGSSNSPGLAPYPESPPPDRYGRSRSPPRKNQGPSRGGRPNNGSSGSERGLAYADSTDDDDKDSDLRRRVDDSRTGYRNKSPPRQRPLAPDATSIRSRIEKPRPASPQRPAKNTRRQGSDGSDYNEPPQNSRLAPSKSRNNGSDQRGGPSSRGRDRNDSDSEGSAYSSRSPVAPAPSKARQTDREQERERERDKERDRDKRDRDRSADSKSLRVGKNDTRSRSPAPRKSDSKDRPAPKPKICLRCEKKITDGKWIAAEDDGVLCERCWKSLYLPRCRRCNQIIEKQAVSSSDGQLKGKYHRECFNCDVCNEPFPDKSFYVHDHQPMCAFHYAEANDSLCASKSCGLPIEGPCILTEISKKKYHPEHLLCEFANGCKTRLDGEYFEVDGLMLCERHSRNARRAEEEADNRGWAKPSTRAKKRMTTYMDLSKNKQSKRR